MKNFPHQINQLPRLARALGVFLRLIEKSQDVGDDGVLGDALASAGVYTFRYPGAKTIEQLLQIEHDKPSASQGSRTCARELRRFFILLRFIRRTNDISWEVSPSARALLALDERNRLSATHEIWRQALIGMELTDAGGSSHPYRILLRLIVEVPGLLRPYAGLCLEARNDSEEEFERIFEIAAKADPSGTMSALAGAHMARNSNKILPSIAEQLDDIYDDGDHLFISQRVASTLAREEGLGTVEEVVHKLVRRPYSPRQRVSGGERRQQGAVLPVMRSYDPDRIGARFNAHEDCLDRLSKLFPPNVDCLQAVYDLLLVARKLVLLVEAKTIKDDDRRQVRAALGQLFYYEHFDVAPLFPDKEILRLALTDCELGEDLQAFLTKHKIGVVWIPEDGKVRGTELGLAHLRRLDARI